MANALFVLVYRISGVCGESHYNICSTRGENPHNIRYLCTGRQTVLGVAGFNCPDRSGRSTGAGSLARGGGTQHVPP